MFLGEGFMFLARPPTLTSKRRPPSPRLPVPCCGQGPRQSCKGEKLAGSSRNHPMKTSRPAAARLPVLGGARPRLRPIEDQ